MLRGLGSIFLSPTASRFYVYMLIYEDIRCLWGTLHREKEREYFVYIIRVVVKK
jgi:hypothetical protein